MTRHARAMSFAAVLVVLCGVFAADEARSQVLIGLLFGDKVSTEKFHLGLNVGVNVADLSGVDGTKARTGFTLGLLGEWRFADHWYLQPELVPFYAVGAKNLPPGELDIPELDPLVTDRSRMRRQNYFAIPVLVKYGALRDRLHLGIGGQVAFLTSAHDLYEGVVENEISIKEDLDGSLAGTDAGLLLHVEYKMAPAYMCPTPPPSTSLTILW